MNEVEQLHQEIAELKRLLQPLRECYGPAGMKLVTEFIYERDRAKQKVAMLEKENEDLIHTIRVACAAFARIGEKNDHD